MRGWAQGPRQRFLVRCSSSPTALVTGASTGIGRATSELLASRGWVVFAGVRRKADGAALQQASPTIQPVLLDVRDDASVAAAVALVQGGLRPGQGLDALVNNAGKGTFAPLELLPLDVFEDTMAVNVTGVLRVTQACLPLLKRPGAGGAPGRVVSIGSYAGTIALPLFGAYSASKFALEALSDVLRYELAPAGVKTILIKAGGVKTPIWSKSLAASEELRSRLPAAVRREYDSTYTQVFAAARDAEETGVEASDVAATVLEALTAPRPRARYLLGRGAAVQMLARRLLPDSWWDPLLLRLLAAKGGPPQQ